MIDLYDRYAETFQSVGVTTRDVANVQHCGGKRLIIQLKNGRNLKVYDLD